MSLSSGTLAQARARQALRSSGLPFDGELEYRSSTRNEVYLSEDYVIRVNRQPNQRLLREADLCNMLPDFRWTPRVRAYGGEVGSDYLIADRFPGEPLSRHWPLMSVDMRRQAIHQLAHILRQLHQVSTPPTLMAIETPPQLLDTSSSMPLASLHQGLDKLEAAPTVDEFLIKDAKSLLGERAGSLADFSTKSLIHGDLSFENILWDGNVISALVDFEWCRGAPADLDLDVLLRFLAIPQGHVAPDYADLTRPEDYREVVIWLASDYPELFSHPELRDRLWIYALAFEVKDLLRNLPPADKRKISPLHSYHRLEDLIKHGGHVEDTMRKLNGQEPVSHKF